MAITVNTKSYTANKFNNNVVGYFGPNNSALAADKLSLSATESQGNATYSGDVRGAARFIRTATLTGALTPSGTAYLDILPKLPRGMASADIDALLNDAGSFLSSADGKTWIKSQKTSW